MATFINVLMLAPLSSFERNKDVVPAVIIFKYKNKFITFNYKGYGYKSGNTNSIALLSYHQSRFELTSCINPYNVDEIIDDKWLLNGFKRRLIRVYAIILANAKTGARVPNFNEFKLNNKLGYDVELEVGTDVYSKIKLDKNFRFY